MNNEDYESGFLDGLECFAWMREGATYVGTCGTTLKEAKDMFVAGRLWNDRRLVKQLYAEELSQLRELRESASKLGEKITNSLAGIAVPRFIVEDE
jgi:hypothetical protein